MEAKPIVRDGIVRIGDYVSFRFPKYQSYLSAEGILVEDVFVSPELSFFEEHLFQIYVQRQYSATNELEDFVRVNGEDPSGDASAMSHMDALIRGKENETVLNKTVMKNKTGNIVCFGDAIQLLHVKSNKFITVNGSDLARDERENMRVSLSDDGGVLSWIKIMPRYKINREGEPLTNGTEILLKISERANEYLHCADRPPPKGKFREVNSSLDAPTGWKISIYHSAEEVANTALLLTGQLVYIRDPESQSMLSPLSRPLTLDPPTVATGAPTPMIEGGGGFETPWSSWSKKVTTVEDGSKSDNENDDDVSLSSFDEYIRDHGCVAFRLVHEDTINSDALWMMESKSITKGGILKYKTDRVHFRHLNSGLYLGVVCQDDHNDGEIFRLTLEPRPSERYTLFTINELHSPNEVLSNAKAVQIKHFLNNVYLERGHYNDGQKVHSASLTRTKAKAVSLIMSRYAQKDKMLTKVLSATGAETLDIYFSKAAAFHLSRYCKALAMPSVMTAESSTVWPRLDKHEAKLFTNFIARITLFVRGFPIQFKLRADDLTKFKGGKFIISRRQNILREVGVLQLVMTMIKALQPLTDILALDSSTNRLGKAGFVEMGKEVLSECLQLVFDLVRKNTANQLYIADHLLVILEHVSGDKLAAKVAQELLSSNRELQETKIGKREITIFTDKVRETPMNAMYLQLLRTCCSCAGEGLPRNQETVSNILYNGTCDSLVSIQVRDDSPIMVDWGVGSRSYEVFLQPYLANGKIRGKELHSVGLPLITLRWSDKSSRFAAAKIFDKTDVQVNDLFVASVAPVSAAAMVIKSGVSGMAFSKAATKRVIADFVVAQLLLAAEMCLGRNYPIIQRLEHIYSYELLVSLLRLQLSEDLSGAAAYLLLCLYVDREPQTEIPLPRLTRTITEIVKLNNKDLLCVDKEREAQFAFLQVIISNHLASIRNLPVMTSTSNMIRLLHSLVKFNFYGNIDKMKDVIEGLMKCVRRGDYDLTDTADQTGVSMSVKKLAAQSRSVSRRSSRITTSSSKSASATSMPAPLISDSSSHSLPGSPPTVPPPPGSASKTRSLGGELLAGQLLESLESLEAQYIMLIFLACSIAVSIYIAIKGIDKTGELLFEIVVFVVFTTELLLHMILYVIVNGGITGFLSSWDDVLDFISVGLYVGAFIGTRTLALFANIGRATRMITVVRILLKLRNARKLADTSHKDNQSTWKTPDRYLKTPETSLEIFVQMVHVLYTVQTNVEDWRLSILLIKFSKWAQDPKSSKEMVNDIFISVIQDTSELSAARTEESDDILIDLLMYHYPPLVQATLELLMTHHSSAKLFHENLSKLQLISSETGELKYNKLEKIVNDLKRDAETHELWGKLINADHRKISNEMHKNLTELINELRKVREILHFDEKCEPIPFIQNILRNLGCFSVCMKIAQLVSTIDKDETFSECHLNTRNLALTANRVLYWFVLDNPTNQALAYAELKFFIKTIDMKIDSHKLIKAIFHNNIELMESVPKKYIEEFIDMICNIGRFPQYLALMSSIISVGEKNVIGNQYAVIKLMTSPENQKKVVQFFVPVSHPDYAKKIRLMTHYMNAIDVAVDDLPSDLAYHLELMGLLSSCTIGRSGMTTIEAKVQSMFNFVDIVDAILDPQCLLLAKIRLGLFLYNGMLDVETPLPAVKDANCIWKLIIASQDVFVFAKDDLRTIEKNGWEASTSCRQKVEYMLVNAMILESYFSAYYDHTIFKPEAGQTVPGVERIQIKEHQANTIIQTLYSRIMAIYEMRSPLLAREHHEVLFNTLVALNNAAKEKMIAQVENLHDSFLRSAEEYNREDAHTSMKSFDEFLYHVDQSSEIKSFVDDQVLGFIEKIEKLPWKASLLEAGGNHRYTEVCFEPLIERLVHHVRGSIQIVLHGEDTIKFLDTKSTKTCTWILRIFRRMVENRWGMSIYERDDDGGEEQDDAVADLMIVYNDSQMSEMCLDLIAKGVDVVLQSEALKLLVAMLFKEGGALAIQKSIHAHLSQSGSDIFFRTVRQMLNNLMSWHRWNGVIVLNEGDDPELPDELILVRCLQLMCEGHFRPNQDIMREQSNNNTSINLLDDFVLYLQTLDGLKCRTSTTASLAVAATVLEVIQGPCEGNQEYFALNTELIETLNRVIRQHPVHDCEEQQELELKKAAIDIFQALLEGQARKTAVYERMLSVIHVDVILVLCKGSTTASDAKTAGAEQESEESVMLKTESLVLMQMLTDFRPSLKKELDIDDDISKLTGDSVACIELVWRGELQRRFFHIPEICSSLAKPTKDQFVLTVKRASPEDKLYGLLEASKEMYREILHQQRLKSYRLDNVFCRMNQDRSVRLSFLIVCVINVLFIVYYETRDVDCASDDPTDDAFIEYGHHTRCTEIYLSNNNIDQVIRALNIVLLCCAAFTLLCSLLVRAPVIFQAYQEKHGHLIKSLCLTAVDFSTIYYILYLGIAISGLAYYPMLSFLLLDFVAMSPTTQDVLQAVYKPRRQIFMTLVLTMIIVYIFAVYSFFFLYHRAYSDDDAMMTLGNAFRWLLRWALPYMSGVNNMNADISSYRIIDDLAFFLVCTVMLNILKGITIDTFVELRKGLEERMEDTTEKCFICGIEKNTFNRTLDRDAFRNHIKHDQNLWNYIYFIIYIWEQDKDDDDGLETFVRKCIRENDLTWFPMNKAIRLAEFQEKGDVHSLKYRFRENMTRSEAFLTARMADFKEQVNRTMARVEKALEYEVELDTKRNQSSRVRSSNVPSQSGVGGLLSKPQSQGGIAALNSARSTNSGSNQPSSRQEINPQLISVMEHSQQQQPQSQPQPQPAASNVSRMLSPQQKRLRLSSLGSSFNSASSAPHGTASALDADIMGQMHLRVVSIAGMLLYPTHIHNIVVEVISARHRGSTRPLTELEELSPVASEPITPYSSEHLQMVALTLKKTRSSFYMDPKALAENQTKARYLAEEKLRLSGDMDEIVEEEEDQESITKARSFFDDDDIFTFIEEESPIKPMQLMFDMMDNPAILIHEGSLPRADLSKFVVKIQVRFVVPGQAEAGLLGVARVPFITLLEKAHEGRPAEVLFDQRSIEVDLPREGELIDLDEPQQLEKVRLPVRKGCIMRLAVIASHRLLEDFTLAS